MTRSRLRKLKRLQKSAGARNVLLRRGALMSVMVASMPSALAQMQPAPDTLQEIVVTATKRQESAQNVPMSIEVIDTKKIDELNIQDLTDYTSYLPSVSVASGGSGVVPGGSGNQRILMRGVSSDANVNYASTLPTVGTYLDDQPITTITGAVDVHMYDIARVEALAGPQGTLYGASSEAGTVRIITNKPDPSGFSAAYNVQGNLVDHGGPGGVVEGFANIPLSSSAAVRIVGWDVHNGGYIDNVPGTRTFPTSGACIANYSPAPAGCTTSPSRAKSHFNDSDLYGSRAALKVDLNDNWTVTPMLMAQDSVTNGTFGYEPALGHLDVSRFNEDKFQDNWWDASLTVEGKISDFDITYSGAYLKRTDTIHSDYSDYSLAYDVVSGWGALIQNDAGQYINPMEELISNVRYTKESNELRVTTPKEEPVRAIVGLFQQAQRNDVDAQFQIPNLAQSSWVTGYPDVFWLSDYARVDRDVAEFGELSWDALPNRLTATVGIRFAQSENYLAGFAGTHDVYASEAATCFGAGPPGIYAPCSNFAGTVKSNAHTPKANVTYHFDSDRMIYATYAEGFRPGGVNRGIGQRPYLPDYLKSYEIGWKTTWLDHHLRWNGAVFWENWDDFQFSFLGANGLNQTANGGQARIKGIESDLGWVVHGLTVSSSVTLLDPKLTENYCGALNANGTPITDCTTTADPVTGAQLQAPSGTQLPLVSKFKGNVLARYEFPVGDKSGYVQGALVYQSGQRLDVRNLENGLLGGDLDGYATVNFTSGIEWANANLEVFVNNAFDKHAAALRYTQCPPTYCASPQVRQGPGGLVYTTPIEPRLIGIQFSQRF